MRVDPSSLTQTPADQPLTSGQAAPLVQPSGDVLEGFDRPPRLEVPVADSLPGVFQPAQQGAIVSVEGPRGPIEALRTTLIAGKTFSARPVTYSVIAGRAFAEGDVFLGKVSELGEQGKGVIFTGQLWPDALIPYEVLNAELGFRMKSAIGHIEQNTSLRFVERTPQNADAYPDYLSVFRGDGCWSHVGMRGGRQELSLGLGCSVGSTIHELMHAAGVWHEQSREDRDQFVTVHWENIEDDEVHNFQQKISDGEDVGPYDYGSLMHYPRRAFSKNGRPTLTPKDPTARIGNRRALSHGDMASVRQLYP